uniref:UEV domain-containing protein n=1 Tax=Ditylum brightwellii TaxID=49249 RepID=A0A7S1ZAS4_9STRA|mmetsp:Transcript_28052/g.41743  ORF Transcript_28052/g.41743 Transcript_28052/m.41743 type:complete len:468 (+) Transcript_28052:46-1449(+)
MNGRRTVSVTEHISNILQNLGGVYSDPPRVVRDSANLLSSPSGCNLQPSTSSLYENDGNYTPAVLLFSGTVAMIYKGNTYNIPVDMYLPPGYPVRAPVCFVRPVAGMEIKSKHKHVGSDGMIYAPYLNSWTPHGCSLAALTRIMSNIFSASPPVFSKPAASTANGNGGASAAARPNGEAERRRIEQEVREANEAVSAVRGVVEQERRLEEQIQREFEEEEKRRIEREIAEANAAAEAARRADEEERQQEEAIRRQKEQEERMRIEREIAEANAAAEAVRRAEEEERRREEEKRRREEEERRKIVEARSTLTSKVQEHLRANNETCRKEISSDLKDQKRLDLGSSQLVSQISELKKVQKHLLSLHKNIDNAAAIMESDMNALGSVPEPTIDELAIPCDIHSEQMLQLSAENASIGDCLYFLDKALAKGSLKLDVHLKRVRQLAKRQFLVKAHLIKIGQAKAADKQKFI